MRLSGEKAVRRKGESLKELLTSKNRMKKEKLTNCTVKVQSEGREKPTKSGTCH